MFKGNSDMFLDVIYTILQNRVNYIHLLFFFYIEMYKGITDIHLTSL